MSINACIYDARGVLAGCITDSVIARFEEEFESIRNRYFGDTMTPVLGIMEKSLIKSRDSMSADFLNCLKILSRKYTNDVPVGFAQDVSRSYHFLVRYCCSQAVYDEVLEETINQFREAGFDYLSSNSNGFEQDDCLFEYNGIRISIKMRGRNDLYNFWNSDSEIENTAVIHDGADEYSVSVNGCPSDLAEEILGCIEQDVRVPDEDEIVEQIIGIIEELSGI